MEGRWNSTITSAKDRQKQEFKNRVMQLYEESLLSNSLQLMNNSKINVRNNPSALSVVIAMPDPTANERRLETSYTVQLG
jgi:hypothetical protein